MRILTLTIALLALLAMPAFADGHMADEKAEAEAAGGDAATPPADAAEGEEEASAEEAEAAEEDKD